MPNSAYQKIKRWFDDHILWYLGEFLCKKMFRFWQFLGFHLIRNYYYEPIPDTRTLSDKLWEKPSELVGIQIHEKEQLDLLNQCSKYKKEYDLFPKEKTSIPHQYYLSNPHYQAVDAEILYSIIRHFKLRKVYEIGSGYSTFVMADALLKNKADTGNSGELVAIDHDPSKVIQEGFPGLSKVIISKVEHLELSFFSQLNENDILFIDSSHIVKIGGDVRYEFLEIIPRLNKGVLIHIHDIFLPYEYPKDWVLGDYRFWTEQYLLQAFLSFNPEFEILWAGYFMHKQHPEKLKEMFSSYDSNRNAPASFWIRRKI